MAEEEDDKREGAGRVGLTAKLARVSTSLIVGASPG
jgi:hypothetical protein